MSEHAKKPDIEHYLVPLQVVVYDSDRSRYHVQFHELHQTLTSNRIVCTVLTHRRNWCVIGFTVSDTLPSVLFHVAVIAVAVKLMVSLGFTTGRVSTAAASTGTMNG